MDAFACTATAFPPNDVKVANVLPSNCKYAQIKTVVDLQHSSIRYLSLLKVDVTARPCL